MPKVRTQPNPLTTAFGQRIKALRREQGISMQTLGTRSGITSGHMSAIENAHGALNLKTIVKLAKGLGVSPMHLMIWDISDEREHVVELLRAIPTVEIKAIYEQLSRP
jgi:transcriptional regulator with XRE-family HTH domain